MDSLLMYCPYCDKEHELKIVDSNAECIIKGEKIEYVETSLLCETFNVYFDNGQMFDQNLLRARDSYRVKHNLLTSKEISDIRKKYGLSQADLSLILGWGEVTVTRYETKEIQNENYDEILRQINDDPYKLHDYFMLNKDKFDSKKQAKIAKKIFSISTDVLQTNKRIEETLLMRHYTVTDKDRGNQSINFSRILAVIQQLVNSGVKVYKTKLAKLLWYIDMINFKNNKKSITGLAYYHMTYGACPLGIDLILDSKSIECEEIEEEESTKYLIKSVDIDYILSEDEIESIKMVVDKFHEFSSSQIVEYMHKEKAYIETKEYEFIPYEYSKELNL